MEKQLRGGLFSAGWYFAELSRFSISRYHAPVTPDKESQVLLVRVLCGRMRDFDQETRRAMDLRPKEHAVTAFGFQSARGGPHRALKFGPGPPDDSYVHVVYDDAMYYPEFIISFKRVQEDGEHEAMK